MWTWILLGLLYFSSCADTDQDTSISYLALGDSYTIGESVAVSERWPVQLVAALRQDDIEIEDPKIVATTGWTTDELLNAIDAEDMELSYDLVSLLIGVNNQYRDYPIDQFKREFSVLLEEAILYADGKKDRVIVLSIPDYGVTPFGQTKDPAKIATELDAYNAITKSICEATGVKYYDITTDSRLAIDDPSLVASDGLHPSGKMYTNWVNTVVSDVTALFK